MLSMVLRLLEEPQEFSRLAVSDRKLPEKGEHTHEALSSIQIVQLRMSVLVFMLGALRTSG